MTEKQSEPTPVHHAAHRQGFFEGMAPKSSFLFGILTGVAVMSLVGFAVTATIVARGKTGTGASDTGNVAGATAPTNTNSADAAAPTGNPNALRAVTTADHQQGPADAKVTLIEFSDFQCPYCASVHPTIEKLMQDYQGKIRWVFRNFPLESIHPNARPAANAAECIASLGGNDAFWSFADAAFNSQSSLSDTFYKDQATKAGVSATKFEDCYNAKKFDTQVQTDIDEGTSAGVQGTPSTFVNGTLISGALPYDSFKAAIDKILGS